MVASSEDRKPFSFGYLLPLLFALVLGAGALAWAWSGATGEARWPGPFDAHVSGIGQTVPAIMLGAAGVLMVAFALLGIVLVLQSDRTREPGIVPH